MNFSEYQEKARETAIYANIGKNFIYPTLGLAGETGEVIEKIKKLTRDSQINDASMIPDDKRAEIQKEMGDVLWYLAQLSSELGFTLESVAEMNIGKLAARKEKGTLHGSGDNR